MSRVCVGPHRSLQVENEGGFANLAPGSNVYDIDAQNPTDLLDQLCLSFLTAVRFETEKLDRPPVQGSALHRLPWSQEDASRALQNKNAS